MLNEIPMRLREHADRQQQNAKEASDAVAQLESEAIDAAGGKAAREALEKLSADVAALDDRIVSLQDQRDEALKTQRDNFSSRAPSRVTRNASLLRTTS